MAEAPSPSPTLVSWEQGLAPTFSIEVEGQNVGPEISALVQRMEYEEADGMASALKMVVKNPDYILSRKKILQPGNEVAVSYGYGTEKAYVGRAVIVRHRPTFAQAEFPSIEVTGYSKDYQMMSKEPLKGKERVFALCTLDTVVMAVADRWKMAEDIDPCGVELEVVQKAGMSDWELVKGCSNISNFFLWVDADKDGTWTLHFKSPASPLAQKAKIALKYNSGEDSTLASFEPEMLIQGGMTKLRVLATDCVRGESIDEEVEAEDDPAGVTVTGTLLDDLKSPPQSRAAIKLFIKDYSFTIVPRCGFANAGQATAWAQAWYRRHERDFVTARGSTLIGIPSLRARQIHAIKGTSPEFDGDYYFSRVAHVFSNDTGYTCDFDCRKVIK